MGFKKLLEYRSRAWVSARELAEEWGAEISGENPYDALALIAEVVEKHPRSLWVDRANTAGQSYDRSIDFDPCGWTQGRPPSPVMPRTSQSAVQQLRTIVSTRGDLAAAQTLTIDREAFLKALDAERIPRPHFLEPPSLLDHAEPAAAKWSHSSDFRTVVWYGSQYEFTHLQAQIVRILWAEHERQQPGLSEAGLRKQVDSASNRFRLRDIFRQTREGCRAPHPAWGQMIRQRGPLFYLAAPERPPTSKTPE